MTNSKRALTDPLGGALSENSSTEKNPCPAVPCRCPSFPGGEANSQGIKPKNGNDKCSAVRAQLVAQRANASNYGENA